MTACAGTTGPAQGPPQNRQTRHNPFYRNRIGTDCDSGAGYPGCTGPAFGTHRAMCSSPSGCTRRNESPGGNGPEEIRIGPTTTAQRTRTQRPERPLVPRAGDLRAHLPLWERPERPLPQVSETTGRRPLWGRPGSGMSSPWSAVGRPVVSATFLRAPPRKSLSL